MAALLSADSQIRLAPACCKPIQKLLSRIAWILINRRNDVPNVPTAAYALAWEDVGNELR